jgi:hypothetical protein
VNHFREKGSWSFAQNNAPKKIRMTNPPKIMFCRAVTVIGDYF